MTADPNLPDRLAEPLRREGLDTVEGAFAFQGGQDLSKPGLGGRRRTRFTLTDDTGREHALYLKRYEGEPLVRRLQRRWTHGRFATPAAVEVENIRAVRAAGVATMDAVAWGQQDRPLAAGRSYVVVTAVPGDALERRGREFLDRCRERDRFDLVEELTCRLAKIIRRLHAAGLVHRDLYASHVFLDEPNGRPELYLIDLARVFAPRWRYFRWRVKDLAQLRYSMPPAWAESHWAQFLREYLGGSVRPHRWERAVERKAASIRRRAERQRRRDAS
jgi:tRNA A-37 threonylcarbamoyl transferase component Bud32